MANYISFQDGNFTTIGNWKVANVASAQTTYSTYTATTTGYVYNGTGASIADGTVLEGVLMHVARTSATGTVSVALAGSTAGLVTSVTVNASDIPTSAAATTYGNWVFFKFSPSYTCASSQTYKIGITSTTAATVNVFRDGTAANWSRLIRTSTTAGSLAAADAFYVTGENTGPGTSSSYTITMDALSSAITDFGAFNICNLGTLSYGTTASTNYYLKTSGIMNIWTGGTLNIGTSGTPVPSTSTAVLFFDCGSDGAYGIENYGGAFNTYGDLGSKVKSAKLNADAAISATNLYTDVDTSWTVNDVIVIASTTRTAGQAEKRTVSSHTDGPPPYVTISSGLTYAHSGTSPYQAEIILLTRNVQVTGASSSLRSYTYSNLNGTMNCNYTQFSYIGTTAVSQKTYGMSIDSNVSTILNYCSFHENGGYTLYGGPTATYDNITVTYCVSYSTTQGLYFLPTSGTSLTTGNNIIITTGLGVYIGDAAVAVTDSIFSSCTYGMQIIETNTYTTNYNNITVHSCSSAGVFQTNVVTNMLFTNLYCWRNTGDGINSQYGTKQSFINGGTFYGNGNAASNANINLATYPHFNLILKDIIADGNSSYTSPYGLYSAGTLSNVQLINCSFGAVIGHTTTDIGFTAASGQIVDMYMNNTILNSATPIAGMNSTVQVETSKLRSTRHNRIPNSNYTWLPYGTVNSDAIIYRSAVPAERLSPTNVPATNILNLESSPKRVALLSGTTARVGVWARTSVIGDGAAYNGSRARLVVRANPGAGITSDTVLATATVASDGSFEQLIGTTASVSEDAVLEFFVDCDGTDGFITIDDWTVS